MSHEPPATTTTSGWAAATSSSRSPRVRPSAPGWVKPAPGTVKSGTYSQPRRWQTSSGQVLPAKPSAPAVKVSPSTTTRGRPGVLGGSTPSVAAARAACGAAAPSAGGVGAAAGAAACCSADSGSGGTVATT